MKQKIQIGLIALSVLIIIFLSFNFPFITRLVLESKDGKCIKSYSLNKGEYFEINFNHSVNKGYITERYQLDKNDDSIYLKYGWFENYGAGMMDTIDDTMEMIEDENRLRIEFPERRLRNVKFSSAGIANHILVYGDEKFDFFKQYPYKTITIGLKKISIKDILIKAN